MSWQVWKGYLFIAAQKSIAISLNQSPYNLSTLITYMRVFGLGFVIEPPCNGSFGTRTNWCVLNKELCTCD